MFLRRERLLFIELSVNIWIPMFVKFSNYSKNYPKGSIPTVQISESPKFTVSMKNIQSRLNSHKIDQNENICNPCAILLLKLRQIFLFDSSAFILKRTSRRENSLIQSKHFIQSVD